MDFQFRAASKEYGGLRPDGVIEINEAKLNDAKVSGSQYDGTLSFVELICHEGIHLTQRHLVGLSDGRTENGNLSAQVSEAFYEAVSSKSRPTPDLYWLHPFEVEAREKADLTLQKILSLNPDLNTDHDIDREPEEP